MGKNIERLGRVISNRSTRTAKDFNSKLSGKMELGTINENLALIPDSLRIPIPKGDYMIALQMTGQFTTQIADGHTHLLPGEFRGIKAGDRVLMSWCGNEPVIISIVVAS